MDDYQFRILFSRRQAELTFEAEQERLARKAAAGRRSLFDRFLARFRR